MIFIILLDREDGSEDNMSMETDKGINSKIEVLGIKKKGLFFFSLT